MNDQPTYYIVGPEQRIRDLFPAYNGNDERKSNDGRVLIEMRLGPMKAAEMLNDEEIGLFNHEQILELLASEPEQWGQSTDARGKEYTRQQLEQMRKARLVEIAEAKTIDTTDLTKEELIDEILKNG